MLYAIGIKLVGIYVEPVPKSVILEQALLYKKLFENNLTKY
jgi:hypothetical protein